MRAYLDLMQKVLDEGTLCLNERTHHSTLRLVGPQLEFWVNKGFPIVTTRKMSFDKISTELDWFLQGNTNTKYLKDRKNGIWDQWALGPHAVYHCQGRDKFGNKVDVGDCGPIYGAQWTKWKTSKGVCLNQLTTLLERLKKHPFSRRHIVSAWNPEYLPDETLSPQMNVLLGNQCLAPCHTMFQVFIEPAPLWAKLRDHGKEEYKKYAKFENFRPVHEYVRERYESRIGHQVRNVLYSRPYLSDKYLEKIADLAFEEDIFSHEWEVGLRKRIDTSTLENLHKMLNTTRSIPFSRAYTLHLKMYARSQDLPIGTAFNISSYALLLSLLAHELDHIPGKYIHTMGDAHIYTNQIEKLKIQLSRDPHPLPQLTISDSPQGDSEEEYYLSPLMKGKGLALSNYLCDDVITYPIAI